MRIVAANKALRILVILQLAVLAIPGPTMASMASMASEETESASLDADEAVLALVEEQLLALEKDLVAAAVEDRRPSEPEALFAHEVEVQSSNDDEPQGLTRVQSRDFRPWFENLQQFSSVSSLRVFMVEGRLQGAGTFASQHAFAISGTNHEQHALHTTGKFDLEWLRMDDGWRIVRWRDRPAQSISTATPIFRDATSEAFPGQLLDQVRRSEHEEIVERYLKDPPGFRPPHPQFAPVSHDRHPAISVVDIDGDGWDDLYVTVRWGRNQLLRNLKDGTFEEVGHRYGLDLPGLSSCALFLDLDNDDDLDLFLCRTLERSQILLQEKGRFVDRSHLSTEPLPMHVASASAADYDLDGRLDIYVATYAKTTTRGWPLARVLSVDESLPVPEKAQIEAMEESQGSWTNVYGPANVLLRNLGSGRFERAGTAAGDAARTFRHTYQASWADYDLDGDPDLYLANDYAPNNLLRNRGDGTFEDVTAASDTEDRGFGMGASWGDYDLDGKPDLYVSNMFSKAGRRVVRRLLGEDSDLAEMARGNSLLRNQDSGFERVSTQDAFNCVERTGWSWGGQFVDVDNDGWLDLAVLNGYYTVPEHLRKLPVDT